MGADGDLMRGADRKTPARDWRRAQRAEHDFWLRHKVWILSEDFRTRLRARAERVEHLLRQHTSTDGTPRLLEVGGGAAGLVDLFEWGIGYGCDPLATLYRRKFASVLNPGVSITAGRGESLPYPGQSFDIVIICNVLDHCESPDRVLRELWRVLQTGGLVYLSVNTYGMLAHAVKTLKPEAEHPHVYTHAELANACCQAGFRMVDDRLDHPAEMWRFYPLSGGRLRTATRWGLLQLGYLHYSELLLRR